MTDNEAQAGRSGELDALAEAVVHPVYDTGTERAIAVWAFRKGHMSRDAEVAELRGVLDLEQDEYVDSVGIWKIIQRLEAEVAELKQMLAEMENKLDRTEHGLRVREEQVARYRDALEKFCAMPLPLDEFPKLTVNDALTIFAERINIARNALSPPPAEPIERGCE